MSPSINPYNVPPHLRGSMRPLRPIKPMSPWAMLFLLAVIVVMIWFLLRQV